MQRVRLVLVMILVATFAACRANREVSPLLTDSLSKNSVAALHSYLADSHFHTKNYIQISWDLVLDQLLDTEQRLKEEWKQFLTKNSKKIIFGTDVVAPDAAGYAAIIARYERMFAQLPDLARVNIQLKNYEKLFNQARARVRAWEHLKLS